MDLPILDRSIASKRFEKAFNWEIVAMLAGALSVDHYWAERVMILPGSTLSFLRRAMLEGVPDVGWIGDWKAGTLSLRDIVARADDVRSAPMSCPIGCLITRSRIGGSGPIMENRDP